MATARAGGHPGLPLAGRRPRGSARPSAARPGFGDDAFADAVARAAGAVIAGALLAAGLVLAARRLAGGFSPVDPGLAWLTLGAGLGLLALPGLVRRGGRGAAIAARIGLVVGVAAVSLPVTSGGWTSLLPVVAAAGAAALPLARRPVARPIRLPLPAAAAPRGRISPAPVTADTGTVRRADPPAGRLHQRFERYEAADGGDVVSGHVRLAIPAGGRITHAHVGFCPAFSAVPTVQVSTDYDGVEAVVAAAEVVPWGVRIECRLNEPAEEPLEIPVDLIAKCPRT